MQIDALRSPTFTVPRGARPHPGRPPRGAQRDEPRSHEAPALLLPSSKDHVREPSGRVRVRTAELVEMAELAGAGSHAVRGHSFDVCLSWLLDEHSLHSRSLAEPRAGPG